MPAFERGRGVDAILPDIALIFQGPGGLVLNVAVIVSAPIQERVFGQHFGATKQFQIFFFEGFSPHRPNRSLGMKSRVSIRTGLLLALWSMNEVGNKLRFFLVLN